ncbi:unnamed protein product [Rotaria socialis]
MKSFHWIGILIEFKNSREIQQAEYIDSMWNSECIPEKLQQQLKNFYSHINFSSRKIETHSDPARCEQLIIENLLKRVEELQVMDENYQQPDDSHNTIYNNEQNHIFQIQHNPFKLQDTVPTNLASSNVRGSSSILFHSENDREEEYVLLSNPHKIEAENNRYDSGNSSASPPFPQTFDIQGIASVKSEQQEAAKVKEHVKNLYDDYSSMPSCLEKSIIRLLFLISLKHDKNAIVPDDNIVTPSNIETEILEEFKNLDKHFGSEKREFSEISNLIEEGLKYVQGQNWESASDPLRKILQLIRPLDVQELFRLVQRTDEAAQETKEEDIILLIGGTGAGKSTMIHFLGGSILEQVKVEGLDHIHPVKIKNPHLIKITTTPFARSETRFITSVRINFKDVGGSTNDSVLLCDSPGFGDTRGPEIDIANRVGISKAIKTCKSVKVVVLISYLSMGDRFEGVKDLARILTGLIPEIQDHVEKFFYIFTKFPSKKYQAIHASLVNIHDTLNERDKRDASISHLLKDMIRKVKKEETLFLNLLKDEPEEILLKLTRVRAIYDPDVVFGYSITAASRNALQEQIRRHQSSIKSAIEGFDYLFVKYKLDQLKHLNEILDQQNIKNIYDDCIEHIAEHLLREYDRVTVKMSRCLVNENILTSEDIRLYQICMGHAGEADQLRESHLCYGIDYRSALIQYLEESVDVISKELKDKEINDLLVKTNLDKIKFLSESFLDMDKNKYKDICTSVGENFQAVIRSFESSMSSNNFNQSADDMRKVHEASSGLQDHLDSADMKEKYDRMKEYFVSYLHGSVTRLNCIFEKTKLSEDDIASLISCISMLETAKKNAFGVHAYILNETIDHLYDNVLSNILGHFEKIVEKIDAELKNENALHKVGIFVAEIDLIRQISIIKLKTTNSYDSALDRIIEYLQKSKKNAEILLQSLRQPEDRIDHNKLKKCLRNLKSAKWITTYRNEEYSVVMSDVEEQLIQCIKMMREYIMEANLDLEGYSEIQLVCKIALDINELKQLDDVLPNINQYSDEVNSRIESEINKICALVGNLFNEEKLNEQEFQRRDFHKVEKACRYLDACKKSTFLLEKQCTSTLDNLEIYIKRCSDLIQNKMETCFENIRKLEHRNKETILKETRALSNHLQEALEIKEKYSRVFSCFSNIKIVEQWKEDLSNYQIELEDIVERLYTKGQIDRLNDSLSFTRTLSYLDRFLEGKKYSDINSKFTNLLLEETKGACKRVTDAIIKYEYESIERELKLLQSSDLVEERSYEKTVELLNERLNDLMEETKNHAFMIGNDLEIERIKSIVKNLRWIKKAKQYVSKYLNVPTALDECVKDVKSTIEDQLKCFFNAVKALVNVQDIYEVDQKLVSVISVKSLLDNLCDKAVFDPIKLIKQNQERVILYDIGEKYSCMKLDMYVFNPPTDIFIKLEEASKINQLYRQALGQVQTDIFTKFRQELALAKSGTCLSLDNSHIRNFEAALRYLPITMQRTLQQELEYVRNSIDRMITNENDKLKQVVSSRNINDIKDLLQKYRVSDDTKYFANEGRNLIMKQVQDIVEKIKQHFEQGEVSEALADAKIFYKYKYELEPFIIMTKRTYSTIPYCIETQFETAQFTFFYQFLKNNTPKITPETINTVEKRFRCLIEFVKFIDECDDQSMLNDMLPDDFREHIIELNRKTSDYFENVESSYAVGLERFDIVSLRNILDFMLKWDLLLTRIRKIIQTYDFNYVAVNSMIDAIRKVTHYPLMLKSISEKIQKLSDDIIHQNLINHETNEFSPKQDEFYQKLNKKLLILDNATLLSEHIEFDVKTVKQTCLKATETKIGAIYANIQDFLKNFSEDYNLNSQDFKDFNIYYCNLLSIRREMKEINFEILDKIDKIEKNILDKVGTWEQSFEKKQLIDYISTNLIKMKNVGYNIPLLENQIHYRIDRMLNNYAKETKGSTKFSELRTRLIQDISNVGQSIIKQHKAFQCYELSLFHEKTKQYGITYVLENLQSDTIDKIELKKQYDKFKDLYKALIKMHFETSTTLNSLRSDTQLIVGNIKQTSDCVQWNTSVRSAIPVLLAHIFAVWTLKNAEGCFEIKNAEDKENYLFEPHAAQVISIFCMLGIGDENGQLINNLVQIGAGEGKSITLGVTAAILALLGFDVHCACYSKYLSEKNYRELLPLFDSLGVAEYIRYGTINKLYEDMINRDGNVCQMVEELIFNNSNEVSKSSEPDARAKILLIDEVDALLNKNFYGNAYTPSARLRDCSITSLINFIWNQRILILDINEVKDSDEYKACCNRFPNWEPLILEAVKDLINDVNIYTTPEYVVKEDKIVYKEQDDIAYNIVHGYKTLFAYYCEHEKGNITTKSLQETIGINIRCGSFSYSEISAEYIYIMGVTGTLEKLNDKEKQIIKNIYKIKKNTYIPSMFQKNKLVFREKEDVKIAKIDAHYNVIQREIDVRLRSSRAILVFFESKQKLNDFYESTALEAMKQSVAIVTEEAESDENEQKLKCATMSGQVTLLTRVFGRGVDFKCCDRTVEENGGTHVIQTFLSEEYSEEIQIKGRTARQGDCGSYSMVLLDSDLNKFLIQRADIMDAENNNILRNLTRKIVWPNVYSLLCDKRKAFLSKQYEEKAQFIEQARQRHEINQQFLSSIRSRDVNHIREFIVNENKGANR